ncbi:MAG: BA14K family protein [Roseibium sp.]|uniref:BA14K family protein n=1 Tax=Roseibium sp. TaxID=1936156 RepID=UPI001B243C2D|nr:BA14K family protein [Roseibium sp.]MBO6511456.1 BA14K family protein [Roseibium sp.]MBO6890461.1 BA14K family protein [Roseibium sp.]MBO6931308.1 BA14K family protein [Roseibium sp.]
MFRKVANTSVALALVAGAALTVPTQSAKAAEGWQVGVGIAGGLAAGAILGSALSQPRYHAPPPVYYPAPAPVVVYRPAPWSPAWYNYCSRKYRSFNPNTGYFLAYSGQYKFCR